MSRILTMDFEDQTLYGISGYTGASIVSASGLDMDGNYCLELSGINDQAYMVIPAAAEYLGTRLFRCISLNVPGIYEFLYNSTNLITVITNLSTGLIETYRGTTLIATGTIPLLINTTYEIEAHVVISDTVGVVQIKVGGVLDINFSGDTKPGTDTAINIINFGNSIGLKSALGYQYLDNLVIDNANWIGNVRFQTRQITANGTYTDLTPSAGDAWNCIEEIPPSLADYIHTNTVNHKSSFLHAALDPSPIATIKSVTIRALAIFEGAPTPTHIQLGVRSGSTDSLSADKSPPCINPIMFQHILEIDPNTGVAWLVAGVNDAELLMKVTA